MADTIITQVTLGKDVSYRQAQMPFYVYGTFIGDDTDYHAFKVDGRGKAKLTYCVDNATNKTATVTLYGMHTSDGEVGDTGVVAIDSSGFTVAATGIEYEECNDGFPYHLIRIKFAATPDSETITVYADFQAF